MVLGEICLPAIVTIASGFSKIHLNVLSILLESKFSFRYKFTTLKLCKHLLCFQ